MKFFLYALTSLLLCLISGCASSEQLEKDKKSAKANGKPKMTKNGHSAKPGIIQLPDYALVKVFYATDRKPVMDLDEWRRKFPSEGSDYAYYGSEFGELEFGECVVSIPTKVHLPGEVNRPGLLTKESPEKHFKIWTLTPVGKDQFIFKVDGAISNSSRHDLFVFVHGYNVKFADAIMRTAQLKFDWEFEGASVLYSWPSKGTYGGYTKDEETIQLVEDHLKHFLKEVVAKTQATNIHLVAHSMGNRALAQVLKSFASEPNRPSINEVVLAAPDINRIGFINQLAPIIPAVVKRISLYASSKDKALIASRKWHDYPRAGEAIQHLVVCKGVETIDASNIDTDLLGHSLFAEARPVLNDIALLLREGKGATQRNLESQSLTNLIYFRIREP